MLMLRPEPIVGTETVNDADGFIVNFWRSVQADPEAVAHWCDRPVFECDLHAIHIRLKDNRSVLTARLEGDPDYFDPKIAGWWAWGQCCWVGSGWCQEGRQGPWDVIIDEDGARQLVHLGNAGRGVNRKRVHLGNAGRGVNRKRVHLGNAGQDGEGSTANGSGGLVDYFGVLSDRLRRVRVCCGDWTRVCGSTPTVKQGLTAVFLDPPYADSAQRDVGHGGARLYVKDSLSVAHAVREWAIAHGDDPRLRIALCGYQGEHQMPASWAEWAWKAKGGYGSQSKAHDNPNARKERIWFSPHCVKPRENTYGLFDIFDEEDNP